MNERDIALDGALLQNTRYTGLFMILTMETEIWRIDKISSSVITALSSMSLKKSHDKLELQNIFLILLFIFILALNCEVLSVKKIWF